MAGARFRGSRWPQPSYATRGRHHRCRRDRDGDLPAWNRTTWRAGVVVRSEIAAAGVRVVTAPCPLRKTGARMTPPAMRFPPSSALGMPSGGSPSTSREPTTKTFRSLPRSRPARSSSMFEGEHALGPVLDELSETWRVTEVSHKPYPCGRATHAVVDACLGFRERLGLDRAARDVVEQDTARVSTNPPSTSAARGLRGCPHCCPRPARRVCTEPPRGFRRRKRLSCAGREVSRTRVIVPAPNVARCSEIRSGDPRRHCQAPHRRSSSV